MRLRHYNVQSDKTYGFMVDEPGREPYGTSPLTDAFLERGDQGKSRQERFDYYAKHGWNNGRAAVEAAAVASAATEKKMERHVRTAGFWPDGHGGFLPVGALITADMYEHRHRPTYVPRLGNLSRKLDRRIIDQEKLHGGNTSMTKLLTFEDNSQAVYKNFSTNRWGTSEEQADREQLASVMAEAIGVVSPATMRISDSELVMEYIPKELSIDGDYVQNASVLQRLMASDSGVLTGLYYALASDPDGHPGNWMVMYPDRPSETVVPIDHGLAFWPDKSSREPDGAATFPPAMNGDGIFHQAFAGGGVWNPTNDMHPEDMALIRTRLEALQPHFAGMGHTDWYEGMMARLTAIEKRAAGTRRRLQ